MRSELRRLPFVLHPLPDEPFDSWFEAMAAVHRATAGEMAGALGLQNDTRPLGVKSWTRSLTESQLERLEHTTGLSSSVLRASTRAGFAANVVQFDRVGLISVRSPATGSSGRFCPECLKDSGGRWRQSWEFAFGFACIRHHRLLVASCPKCGVPPRRSVLPRALVPSPTLCRNPDPDQPSRKLHRCDGMLTDSTPGGPLHPDVVSAQRFLLGVLARGQSTEGIWASSPQPTLRVLADLRFLSRFLVRTGHPLDPSWSWESVCATGGRAGGPGGPFAPAAYSVRESAVAYTAAWRVSQQPERVRQLLRGRVTPHTTYFQLSLQMQSFVAEAKGSRRRPTALLQTAFDAGDPVKRAAKIPARLWPEWTSVLAPNRRDPHIAASALAAATVFTGSRLTHAAAIGLLDSTVSTGRASYILRGLGSSAAEIHTLGLVTKLAEYLDSTVTPIDYARRRSLDYSDLLPETGWELLAREHNVHSGAPRRGALARAYLHRVLSGDGAHRLPPRQGVPPTDAEIDAFARDAPDTVISALHELGERFLRAHGIDEPPSWCPDLVRFGARPLCELTTPENVEPERRWKARRTARGAARGDTETEIVSAYVVGASMRSIAIRAAVSKQTVSRVLDEHGIPRRPEGAPVRHTVDRSWLASQLASGARTVRELATEVGCSETTIRRHLHTPSAPTTQTGSPDEDSTPVPLNRGTVGGSAGLQEARSVGLTDEIT